MAIRGWVSLLLLAYATASEPIRIICPYGGLLDNKLSMTDRGINLFDRAGIYGLFFQWIDPAHFQANAFVYLCPKINYSTVWGTSISSDFYFLSSPGIGKSVAGAGGEIIEISTKTTDELFRTNDIEPLHRFDLNNAVIAPFLRAGYRFEHNFGHVRIFMFPWAGVQQELVRGNLYIEPTPLWTTAMPPIAETISEDHTYALAGCGAGVNFFHFVDIEAKMHRMIRNDVQYNHYSSMINLFLSRKWGVSYRFRYMEMSTGTNAFHFFGVAYIF